MKRTTAALFLLFLRPLHATAQAQTWDPEDAERRSVKISVSLPAAIAGKPVTFKVNGVILRENRVLMPAVAALPGATISIGRNPVKIAGWVPQNFAAVAYAAVGKGMALPLIRGAAVGEKVAYVGYVGDKLTVLNGTVEEVIARGNSRIAYIDTFPESGLGFAVWSQKDGALVAFHMATEALFERGRRRGMALGLQMLPERLNNLKPLGIGPQKQN